MRRHINETLSMDSAIIQSKSNWKEEFTHIQQLTRLQVSTSLTLSLP